jgi:hypothetical protein
VPYAEQRAADPERFAGYGKKYRWKVRLAILAFMGGKCVRCGFADPRALQVDHVRAGGRNDREPTNNGAIVLKRVMDPKNAGKFQLLCANCNWIKRYENNEVTGRPFKVPKEG